VSCTTADSYLEASSCEAGAAAELAASNKVVMYARLSSQGEYVQTAVESHGPINRDALQYLNELGSWRLVETTRDVRVSSFLFQRISVVVQRINSVLLHDGFIDDVYTARAGGTTKQIFVTFVIFEPPGFFPGLKKLKT